MTEYNKIAKRVMRPDSKEEMKREIAEAPSKYKSITKATKSKKPLMERLVVALIGPDGLPAVGRYVAHEVVGPAVKNMLVDTVTNGIQMLVFKDGTKVQPRTSRNYSSSTYREASSSYRKSSRSTYVVPESPVPVTSTYNHQELSRGVLLWDYAIPTREEARNVIEALQDIGYEYGIVKVREYYDLIGHNTVYTDNNFGWTFDMLERLRIRTVREGFVIDLPPIQEVN